MGAWFGRQAAIDRSRRRAQLLFLALICVLLAPGTWLRTTLPVERIEELIIAPLPFASAPEWPSGLSVEGLWVLRSPDPFFGGYSALLPGENGRAIAYSDRGEILAFNLPGFGVPDPRFIPVQPDPRFANERQDIESATTDPDTGRLWLGYEQVHAIRRFGPDEPHGAIVQPPQMSRWPKNSGAEAMVRLRDGRFLVFGERNSEGLLFRDDPVAGARALEFTVDWPGGYSPVDAAELPDGRILLLMRTAVFGWPVFRSTLVIGDPRQIAPDRPWRPVTLARLDGPLPRDNYEALAIEREGTTLVLWLMSDDNLSATQRTILAKLRWRP